MSTQNIAETYIGQGSLTNSKHPAKFVRGSYPTHAKKGYACYLWDENDVKYIDYICGLGTNLVGYHNKAVTDAVKTQIEQGVSLSLSSVQETDFAREFVERFGVVQKIKILKTGTEGCMAAVKIALAHSGRDQIVASGS